MEGAGQKAKLAISCALIVLCGAYALHSIRAAAAARTYLAVKFGLCGGTASATPPVADVAEAARRARRAGELYPANYLFYSHVALLALDAAQAAEDSESHGKYLSQALYFSTYGINLNPYNEETRRAYIETLVEDDRCGEAIEYWREKVMPREFWVGINHNTYASLLLRSSRPEDLREVASMEPMIREPELRKKIQALKKSLR
jgi:hypothetical protein